MDPTIKSPHLINEIEKPQPIKALIELQPKPPLSRFANIHQDDQRLQDGPDNAAVHTQIDSPLSIGHQATNVKVKNQQQQQRQMSPKIESLSQEEKALLRRMSSNDPNDIAGSKTLHVGAALARRSIRLPHSGGDNSAIVKGRRSSNFKGIRKNSTSPAHHTHSSMNNTHASRRESMQRQISSEFDREVLAGSGSGGGIQLRRPSVHFVQEDSYENDEDDEGYEGYDENGIQVENYDVEDNPISRVPLEIIQEYDSESAHMESRSKRLYEKMYTAIPKTSIDLLYENYNRKSKLFPIIRLIFQLRISISHHCNRVIQSPKFENMILLTIIFNSIMLMLDDPTSDDSTPFQQFTEDFFLWAYTAEAALKIVALGFVLNKNSYLRDGWNFLDFIIVVSSLLPLVIGSATVNLKALRSLRILRPLRTISKVRKLKILLKTLFSAIPYLVNSLIILVFFFLIFAIGGTQLFGGLLLRRCIENTTGIINTDELCGGEHSCADNYSCGKTMTNPQYDVTNFDNIFYAFLMVFQIITMEGWTTIMYYVFDVFTIFSAVYFILLVFIGSFFLLNLTLAVIKAKFSDNQMSDTTDDISNGSQLDLSTSVQKKKKGGGDEEEIEEVEMRVDIVREYRHMERTLLAKVLLQSELDGSPLSTVAKPSSNKAFGATIRDLGRNQITFVWEDMARLRAFQQHRLKLEEKILQQKLRRKLFFEQWRKQQTNKIAQASKRIAKFYKIRPPSAAAAAAAAIQRKETPPSEQKIHPMIIPLNKHHHEVVSKGLPSQRIVYHFSSVSPDYSSPMGINKTMTPSFRASLMSPLASPLTETVTVSSSQNMFASQANLQQDLSPQKQYQHASSSSNKSFFGQMNAANRSPAMFMGLQIPVAAGESKNKYNYAKKKSTENRDDEEGNPVEETQQQKQATLQEIDDEDKDSEFWEEIQAKHEQEVQLEKQLEIEYNAKNKKSKKHNMNHLSNDEHQHHHHHHNKPEEKAVKLIHFAKNNNFISTVVPIRALKLASKKSRRSEPLSFDQPTSLTKLMRFSSTEDGMNGSTSIDQVASITSLADIEKSDQNQVDGTNLKKKGTGKYDELSRSTTEFQEQRGRKRSSQVALEVENDDAKSDNLFDDSDFFFDADKQDENEDNLKYLSEVIQNVNNEVAVKLSLSQQQTQSTLNSMQPTSLNLGDEETNSPMRPNKNFIHVKQKQVERVPLFEENGTENGHERSHKNKVLIKFSPSQDSPQTVSGKSINGKEAFNVDSYRANNHVTLPEVQEVEEEDQTRQEQEESSNGFALRKIRLLKQQQQQQSQYSRKTEKDAEDHDDDDQEKANLLMGTNQEIGEEGEEDKDDCIICDDDMQKMDEKSGRRYVQEQWLNAKIRAIEKEHRNFLNDSSQNQALLSQAVRFEMERQRVAEEESRSREEKMIRNAKNWKLDVILGIRGDQSSHKDVLGHTFEAIRMREEEDRMSVLKERRYEVFHKLMEVQKKQKKGRLARKIAAKKAATAGTVGDISSADKQSRINKIRMMQKSIGQGSQGSLSKRKDGELKSVVSASKVDGLSAAGEGSKGVGLLSPEGSVARPKSTAFSAQIKGSNRMGRSMSMGSSSQSSMMNRRREGAIRLPYRLSKMVVDLQTKMILGGTSREGESVGHIDAISVISSIHNQNSGANNTNINGNNSGVNVSGTVGQRKWNVLSTSMRNIARFPDKKGNNEKIDLHNYEAVDNAINQQIKLENNIKDDFDSFKEFDEIQEEDFQTGIKTKRIFSGLDVIPRYSRIRGVIGKKFNKLLTVLSTRNQELIMWIHGVVGLLKVAHHHLEQFVLGSFFGNLATAAVFGNTIVLALDGTFTDESTENLLDSLNSYFSYIFIGEMALKIIGLTPRGYVRDTMNIFDGMIVSISIFELLFLSGGTNKAVSAFRAVRIFRTFRVLRVTRLLRGLQFMGKIISVVNKTLDSFIYIAFLLFLFIFIFSLLGMQLYGGNMVILDSRVRQNFDSFQAAFISIFQVMTMENWNDILYKAFHSGVNKFLSSVFLIIWIFIGNWIFLNLFLAILLDGFTDQANEEEAAALAAATSLENDEYAEHEAIIQKEEQAQFSLPLNMENLKILDDGFERMDTEEMELLEQEILQMEGKLGVTDWFVGVECSDSLYIFSKQNIFRRFCYRCVKHHHFESIILFFIITSSLKLVVDTYVEDGSSTEDFLKNFDTAFNIIFMIEAFLKIISYGFIGDDNSYLSESWSQIDFFIVCTSILDMSLSGIDISFIKILRLLRTLRPLRFISHNVNMKVVVIALFESVSGILNVLIVILLIWMMFAILGISLIGTRMGYCKGLTSAFNVGQSDCLLMGKEWGTYDTNFDDIVSAMRTLYVVSSLEGWPDIMYQAIDSNDSDTGPIKDNYMIISYFYIVFILIGSFFLVNLFVGVIFLNFNEAQKNESQSSMFLTDEQKRWIEFQQMIIGVKAEFSSNIVPKEPFRRLIYRIITSNKFEIFIMILIVLNIVTMGMSYEGSSSSYDSLLENINLVFTICFIMELIMKFIALGITGFMSNGWNKFDLFVVVSSIVDLLMNNLGASSISFLRIGPQLIRIVRVLRVSRLLKLVKSMKGLQKLIETLMFSLPSLINVGALLMLVFFIYSVLGVFMFQDVKTGVVIDNYNNFSNFGYAMLTLFRCSTGENWYQFMFDCGKTTDCTPGLDCGNQFSTIYYVTFILICTFIMLNLFILIIIQYFEDYHMKDDNPLQAFNDKLEIFRVTWSKYTRKTLGEKINSNEIVDFLYDLPVPLGYFDTNPRAATSHPTTKKEIAKQVMNWSLPQQVSEKGEGFVFFNDVLFACMRKEYGAKLMQNCGPEMVKMLNKLEVETRLRIAQNKKKHILKKNQKLMNQLNAQSGSKRANPLMAFMFLQMAFKAWNNYSNQINRNPEEKHAPTVTSVDSESELEDGGDVKNTDNNHITEQQEAENERDSATSGVHQKDRRSRLNSITTPLESKLPHRQKKPPTITPNTLNHNDGKQMILPFKDLNASESSQSDDSISSMSSISSSSSSDDDESDGEAQSFTRKVQQPRMQTGTMMRRLASNEQTPMSGANNRRHPSITRPRVIPTIFRQGSFVNANNNSSSNNNNNNNSMSGNTPSHMHLKKNSILINNNTSSRSNTPLVVNRM